MKTRNINLTIDDLSPTHRPGHSTRPGVRLFHRTGFPPTTGAWEDVMGGKFIMWEPDCLSRPFCAGWLQTADRSRSATDIRSSSTIVSRLRRMDDHRSRCTSLVGQGGLTILDGYFDLDLPFRACLICQPARCTNEGNIDVQGTFQWRPMAIWLDPEA